MTSRITRKIGPSLLLGLSILMVSASTLGGKSVQSASQILKRADAATRSKTSKIYVTQVVVSPSGDFRTFKMVSYTKDDNDKGLTEYLAPTRVKGLKILTRNAGNDIWSYFPSTNRVRKIASSARNRKVQGSDFSYDDMAMGKMAESWTGSVIGEEKINSILCYKLSLVPTDKGPQSYKKVTTWISKSDLTAVRVLYFDKSGEKHKQLDVSEYRDVNGVKIPFLYTMTSLVDGGKTIMKVAHAEVNIKLSESIFTEAGLN